MQLGVKEMLHFEKMNNCKINVLRCLDRGLVPLRVLHESDRDLKVDFSLIDDGQEYHFLLLKALRLANRIKGSFAYWRSVPCWNCFHICVNQGAYQRHHQPALVKMPDAEKRTLGSIISQVYGSLRSRFTSTSNLSCNQ